MLVGWTPTARRLRWKGGCSFGRSLVDDSEGATTDGEEERYQCWVEASNGAGCQRWWRQDWRSMSCYLLDAGRPQTS
ncbi:hypothetical protein BHM03_00054184 [Ensete ventricosum]|nr:hypothetical protein BHM03_00054184 [Ensete ventricosum]